MKCFLYSLVGILALGGVSYFLFFSEPAEMARGVDSFEVCVEAGYFVIDTFPRQCQTPEGDVFFEDEPVGVHGEMRQAIPE